MRSCAAGEKSLGVISGHSLGAGSRRRRGRQGTIPIGMGDKGSTEEEGEQAEAAEASKRIRVEERRVE